VWKTEDSGLNWAPISDGFFNTGSVGDLDLSASDPNVIYVGMGGSAIRTNVSFGDGVYKSTDSGKTWKHMGLKRTSQIARVCIHPHNPELVYVAALGRPFGPNEERGVFRSKNGGQSWEKILYRDDKTGAVDLILDPSNPRIIYAAFYEILRTPYTLIDGGPGSGIFKSSDGGDTWNEITQNRGLPRGIWGKTGITISPAQPERVWAIIEAKEGGLFRSDDGGDTWIRVNDERKIILRPWYYNRIYADPKDPNTVYVTNVQFYRSIDAGKTFNVIRVPHVDNQDLWIDPDDPQRMINANDGGACITFNGGLTWTPQDNQPTAQFYHVITDNQFPYYVYGAQQDNSTVRIPSQTSWSGIGIPDWHSVGGGESGYIAPRHDNPDIVYAGSYGHEITRWDYKTRQKRLINPWPQNPVGSPAANLKYRFNWTSPILSSRFDANVLYYAGNVLFKTMNEGQSWEVISPDLTTNDKEKQQISGGPITPDNTSAEHYCTIFAIAESFHDPKILWTGTDDGLVHITKDGGQNWANITPKEMPDWGLVSIVETSTFDPANAYIAVDAHKTDDFRPYIFKTSDYGKSWQKITTGIPEDTFVRAVREDPKRKGLLYAGTETGVFVSFDAGLLWQSLQQNLPVVPIHDLVVKDDDLVVATHGRSFWILDDLTPLHQLTEQIKTADFHLFKPRSAVRLAPGYGGMSGPSSGKNPPRGSRVYYFLKEKPKHEVSLEFMDSEGRLIKKFSSECDGIPAEAGLNRFVWDMRYPDAEQVPGAVIFTHALRFSPPLAPPGQHKIKLVYGERTNIQEWEWKKDPRIPTTQQEYQEQFSLQMKIMNRLSEVNSAVNTIRKHKKKIDVFLALLDDAENKEEIIQLGKNLKTKLFAVEENLIQAKSKTIGDPLKFPPMLDNRLILLFNIVTSADSRPTDQTYEYFKEISTQIDAQMAKLKTILETDLPHFFKTVGEADFSEP